MDIGIFTTIKVTNGIPLFFENHYKRLLSHAHTLQIKPPPFSLEDVQVFIKKNKLKECALRITFTTKNSKSLYMIEDRPLPASDKSIKLITIKDTRNKNKIFKMTDRRINEKAKKIAEKKKGDDGVFIKDKTLIESTISNIFSVNKKGQIITPPLEDRGLKGITREIIMDHLQVIEETIPEDTTLPLVLVNSLRIQKVSHLNERKLQDGEELLEKLKKHIKKTESNYLLKRGMAEVKGSPSTNGNELLAGPRATKIFYKKLSTWMDPEIVFTNLFRNKKNAFWLDSSMIHQKSRFSYMGGPPTEIFSYNLKHSKITIQRGQKVTTKNQDIFSFLTNKLSQQTYEYKKLPFPFTGGYVGYFGYELKKLTDAKNYFQSPYPDSLWFAINNFIAFDHQEKKVYLVCLTQKKTDAHTWFTKIKSLIDNRAQETRTTSVHDNNIIFKLDRNHKQYLQDIKKCKEFLTQGESYQICLTNKFQAKTNLDPFTLYLALRRKNPAPYAAYIKHNDLTILCSSPEEFLKIDTNGIVETKPIKGTIKRGLTKKEDQALAKTLSESKKDWSENAMIVDLLRNDLGKVCEFGSVKVDKLMQIESFQTVHQLVSTVQGKLRKEFSVIDSIQACFPGGSMTGAPKIRTMEILESLEKKARGIYSGSIGYLSFNQSVQLNIVIRTLILQKDKLEIGAGGAILFDSDPEKEYEEMLLKAKALIEATQKALYTTHMHKVFLALGTNLGDKKQNIHTAIKLLEKTVKNISVANLYETKPMYYEDQDNFLNTVLSGETTLSPEELLLFVKKLEKKIGRNKTFRNGPREIDIDILFYDDLVFQNKTLQIPHPKLQERDFVLKPLMDIAADFKHPVLKKTLQELFNKL